PDALAIGPYAAQEGYPVLLTRTDSIPGATDEVLGGVDATILVGGIAVISEAVYQEAPDPTRIAGEDRFDTAAHIISQLDIPVDKAYVATGMDFADALTGSALAAKDNASVLLARGERVPEPLEEIIEDEEIDDFTILGGPGAISEAVELQLLGEEAVVEPGEMIFHFFDVGQGDSILIETPCESYVLVDGGPRGAGDDLVSYLNALGVERLDKVVATHEHEDHIGGLISLYESPLEVETTYGSQYQHDTITAENFRDLAQEESNFITAAAFDTLNIDCEYTEMTFIHPYEGASGDIHYMNLVLNIEHQEVSALITGDAEEEAETAMMENASEYLPSDILKVGHHGSRTSTSQPFLDVVSPGTAVIQVGEDNRYGHPHQETLDRLTQAGVDIYRNDISGTLVIASDGTEYEVDTDPYVYHPEDPEPEPHPEPVPGRININTASLEELQEIIHIGPGRAQEIIDLRPFNSLEELTRVSGIGPARLEDIKAEGIAYVE
ncbi:MAG: MBL fold metallo-hydrolase, partial [Candidatus Syntrophonatronum acetioxidans]